MTDLNIRDVRADYHRNGIGGQGSVVAFFRADLEEHDHGVPMMAVLWSTGQDPDHFTECHVLKVAHVVQATVDLTIDRIHAFRSTDHFLPQLGPLVEADLKRQWREQIETWEAQAKRNI